MRHTLLILTLASFPAVLSAAPKDQQNVLDLKYSITDESIIYPESFEADSKKMLESWYILNYTDTDDRYRTSTNPATSDDKIRARLAALPTVIELPFNAIVRNYIDRYVERGRPMVASLLGLSHYYMPIFEQALEAEQLPVELKYLPVIESALDPNAVSRSGAGGLWQFMPAAAKGYGLEISSLVDERRDPYKSSKKAARMLHDLYDIYGDWSLAIAAYNCGSGNVNKAIRRAGGDPRSHDFWSIYNYLSPETRGYLPMFIAANYVMNYYKDHNISPVLPTRPLVTDTIGISNRVHFEQISKVLNIPIEELRILNPQFRADIIPGSVDKQYMLILPAQQVQAYIVSEPEILAYEASKYARRIDAVPGEISSDGDDMPALEDEDDTSEQQLQASGGETPGEEEGSNKTGPERESTNLARNTRIVTHTVSAGETINEIADRYQVKVADIRSWNSLRRNAVRPGQKLRIETSADNIQASEKKAESAESGSAVVAQSKVAAAGTVNKNTSGKNRSSSSTVKKSGTSQTPRSTVHEIKSGENLTVIAKKHGVSVEEIKRANNMKNDNIRAGKTLVIPAKKSSGARSNTKKSSSSKRKSSGR